MSVRKLVSPVATTFLLNAGLLDFFLYCVYNSTWKHKMLGTSRKAALYATTAIRLIELYRHHITRKLAMTKGKFMLPEKIKQLDSFTFEARCISKREENRSGYFMVGFEFSDISQENLELISLLMSQFGMME